MEREFKASMEKKSPAPSSTEPGGRGSLDEAGEMMGQAMSKAFRVRSTLVYYVEICLAILIGVLMVIAGGLTDEPPRQRRRPSRLRS